ncbi:hypothetical protein ACHQM5_028633 [Ranunculus cassubicifolius]
MPLQLGIRYSPSPSSRLKIYRPPISSMGSSKRPECSSCSKPIRLCLCSRFKTPLFNNQISVTILQHKQEMKHPLNTARIANLGLKNITIATASDVHLQAKFLIYLLKQGQESSKFSEEPDITATMERCGFSVSLMKLKTCQNGMEKKPDFDLLLDTQIGKDAVFNGFVVKKLHNNQINGKYEFQETEEYNIVVPPRSVLLFPTKNSIQVEDVDFEVKNLIVLDGTWAKARRMYYENPWLKLLPHLKLDMSKVSLYKEVRLQPKVGCVSTIESIVAAMKALGDNGEELDNLLDVFESMVVDQRRCKDERISKLSET